MSKQSQTFSISLKLLADQFVKGVKSIERQIKGLGNFVKGAFALGTVTAFGRQMVQVSSDFEHAMAQVQAVSNASAADFKKMGDEARHLGATTKYTATEAANALEKLTRNGLSASQATQALSGVLKLAQANDIGLAEAANITTNVMNMFGKTTKDTADINDILSATAANTATNISELYEALVNAAPTAHNLGIGLEEVTSALGAMAQRGVKGAESGTQLRMALTKMIDPKIVAKMEAMGVAINEQTIRSEGLIKTLGRLKEANLDAGQLVGIFSQRGAHGMMQLINAYNDLERTMLVINDAQGTTSRMFQQGLGSTRGALLMLKSAYQDFLIEIGERTRGPLNSLLQFLTDIVRNSKNMGVLFANIASVTIPMFTKNILNAFKIYNREVTKGIAKATALKAAMGNWITVLVSAGALIATNLIAKINRTEKEAKRLEDEFANVSTESIKLKGKVDDLVKSLGTTYDKDTLNGVVLQLCRLFPDMRDRILEAARAADDTQSYDKLKGVLSDILKLQAAVSGNAVLNKIAENYTQGIADTMKGMGKGLNRQTHKAEAELYDSIKKGLGQAGKGQIDAVYSAIADAIARSNSFGDAIDRVKDVLASVGIEVSDAVIYSTVQTQRLGDNAKKAAETYEKIANNNKVLEADEKKTAAAKKEQEEAAKKQAEADRKAADAAEAAKDKAKKLKKIDDDFNREVAKAQNDLANGWIDAATYQKEYAKAVKKAYDDLSELIGFNNKYKEARDMVGQRERLENTDLSVKHPMNLFGKDAIAKAQSDIPDTIDVSINGKLDMPELKADASDILDDTFTYFVGYTDFVNGLGDALGSLSSAFDKLADSDSNFFERFKATGDILNAVRKSIEDTLKLVDLLSDEELAAAAKEILAGKLKRKEAEKNVAANTAEAVTGTVKSQAGIPLIGPFLAAGMVATILGVIAANTPKFAKGGIVGGSSKHGDKLLARLNSGEMVLNGMQQKRLLDMANGKAGAGNAVSFHISGKDLVGVLRNNNSANSKISGYKGF